jgi:hypothetical protein
MKAILYLTFKFKSIITELLNDWAIFFLIFCIKLEQIEYNEFAYEMNSDN